MKKTHSHLILENDDDNNGVNHSNFLKFTKLFKDVKDFLRILVKVSMLGGYCDTTALD